MYKKIHAFPSIKSVAFSVLSRFHFVTMQKKPIDVTLHFSKKSKIYVLWISTFMLIDYTYVVLKFVKIE